jgi:hypothetical protein
MADALVSTDGIETGSFRTQHHGAGARVSPWIRRCSMKTPPLQLVASESGGRRPRTSARRSDRDHEERCNFCGRVLGPRNSSGRRRIYCSQSCRQRAYQTRKRAAQLGLREGEMVVSGVMVTRLNKGLKNLDAALAQVENAHLEGVDERIQQLCQAAKRLRKVNIGNQTH